MSDPPLVSVVLRTYERPNLVSRAIESVLDQTYDNFELIVIDDHSKDETPEIVRGYEEQDERIQYIRNEENRGHVTTLNVACREAVGEYVAFLDDDDVWLPGKLKAQVERIEELGEEYALVYGATRHMEMETDETIFVARPELEGDIYWEILERGSGSVFGPPSNVMIRRSVLEELNYFDEQMSRGSGQKLFRNIAKRFKIAYTDELCVNYYVHDDRVTTIESKEELEDAIRVHKRKLDDLGDDLNRVPRAYLREHERIGNLYCVAGDMRTGRSHFKRAIDIAGIRATLLLRLVLSYFGGSVYRTFFTPEFRFRHTIEKYERYIPFAID